MHPQNTNWIITITSAKWTIYSKKSLKSDIIQIQDSRFIYRLSSIEELQSLDTHVSHVSNAMKGPFKKVHSMIVSLQVLDHLFSQWGIEYPSSIDRLQSIVEFVLVNNLVQVGCIVGRLNDSIQMHIHEIRIADKDVVNWTDVAMVTNQTIIQIIDTPNTSPTDSLIQSLETQFKSLQLQKEDTIPGLELAFQRIMEMIVYPVLYKDAVSYLNINVPKGLLLHGPPGTGKTRLVQKVVQLTGAHLISIQGSQIFSPFLGDSEKKLSSFFEQAQQVSQSGIPCIIFIDEIDALSPKRSETQGQETRITTQLLILLDGLKQRNQVVVIAATNRPNALDPALRRPGRLERELAIDVPTLQERLRIFQSVTNKMSLSDSISLDYLAQITNGYVAADIVGLCREAAMSCLASTKTITKSVITLDHFEMALKKSGGASVKKGYQVSFEKLEWSCLGGVDSIRNQLVQLTEWPLKHFSTFKKLGLKAYRGILLYGPPGCSKTTIAKITASTCGAAFYSLNGAQIYSAYVGESERIIRELFSRARMTSPSVIFLDELEAIVGKRGSGQADVVQDRILSTLLNEMDGIESLQNILVMGATNIPDMIDDALLRPGRFDKTLYIGPPNTLERRQIFDIYLNNMPMDEDISLDELAERTSFYSGADIKSLCREAALEACRRDMIDNQIQKQDFERALRSMSPSITLEMIKKYESCAKTKTM